MIFKDILPIFLKELVLESAFEVVMFHFMEAIHIELPYKTIHFFVSEISGEDKLLKLNDIFDDKLESVRRPVDNFLILLDLWLMGEIRRGAKRSCRRSQQPRFHPEFWNY